MTSRSPREAIFSRRSAVHSPPLFAILDAFEKDELVRTIETWVSNRTEMFDIIRAYVQDIKTEKVINDENDILANVRKIAKGTYGTVSVGCIVDIDRAGTCKQFRFNTEKERRRVPFYVASKIITEDVDLSTATLDAMARDYDGNVSWEPAENVAREIISGRMANYLVMARITPHFPFLFETFETTTRLQVTLGGRSFDVGTPQKGIGILSELSHIDFRDFMISVFPTFPKELQPTVFQALLAQITQGLAAMQTHFNWRHNDFHTKNVMITFVERAEYCYVVNKETYKIPNYGLCCRIIDYGLSSSDVLFPGDDNVEAYKDWKTIKYTDESVNLVSRDTIGIFTRHMVDASLNDFVRFISDFFNKDVGMYKPMEHVRLREMVNGFLGELSPSDSYAEYTRIREPSARVKRITRESRGEVMRDLFQIIAKPFRADLDDCAEVYDMKASVFLPDHPLDAFEARFFTVGRDRTLRPIVST